MKVFSHANHIVVTCEKYPDLLDPLTGQLQRFPTQRAAKWSATVYARLRSGFGERLATAAELQTYLTPTTKELT